jgi:thymidylate kinase
VALSGLDGAGKSTHASALSGTLIRLGFDVTVRWTSLSHTPGVLQVLRTTADRLLILAGSRANQDGPIAAAEAIAGTPPARPRPADTAAKRLRRRSRSVAFCWTSLVALRNGLVHRRATRPHLSRGRVVICDRYILDSKVQLRYDYGESRRFAFQMWLIRLLSPKADRSFLLDVSPETASARKADYDLSENARRARLYAEESTRLGVRRVDAERPRCEVCAELAADVWSALEKRESRAVPLRREHHNRNPPRQSARSDPSTAC